MADQPHRRFQKAATEWSAISGTFPGKCRPAKQSLESEQKLRLATEAAELGIWHWYPDEDLASWDNDRCYEIHGRTREDGPLNRAEFVEKIVHPDDREAFNRAMAATLETGARLFFQGRIYRKDKSVSMDRVHRPGRAPC